MNTSTASTQGTPKDPAKCPHRQVHSIQVPLVWLELVFGLVLLLVAGTYLYEAAKLPDPMNPKAVGAGDFPMIIAIGTLIAVFLMCCHGLVKIFREKEHERVELSRPLSVIIAVLILGGIGAFLDSLGAIIATAGLSALLMIAVGERRPLHLIAVPMGLALGLYAIFVLALGVYFP
ncbi:MAG: tripartite tricarboxylate transporter TctB family protein [Oceanospirillaceae bacterium]|nr:tripartite tricarboxylate transporter TctB family protein [Oceanospirillaceae bacterium]